MFNNRNTVEIRTAKASISAVLFPFAKSLLAQWRSSHRLLVLPPFGHWYTVFAVLNGEFTLRSIAALLGYG